MQSNKFSESLTATIHKLIHKQCQHEFDKTFVRQEIIKVGQQIFNQEVLKGSIERGKIEARKVKRQKIQEEIDVRRKVLAQIDKDEEDLKAKKELEERQEKVKMTKLLDENEEIFLSQELFVNESQTEVSQLKEIDKSITQEISVRESQTELTQSKEIDKSISEEVFHVTKSETLSHVNHSKKNKQLINEIHSYGLVEQEFAQMNKILCLNSQYY